MNEQIKQDVSLKELSNLRVGGKAKFFSQVRDVEELDAVLDRAKRERWLILVLAAGTNLIFPDDGFNGLVIKVAISGFEINGERLTAGAAASMQELVDVSINAGLAGLEWAGGLPGTFGGAIRGNAGAFRGEIKDCVESVTSIEQSSGRKITRQNDDCIFGYRDSIFKRKKEVIVSATVKLMHGNRAELRTIADSRIEFRRQRHPLEYPNVGSIFKNTPLDRVPDNWLPHFHDFIKTDPFPIVPSGKIIEDSGLKGYRIGDAQVSQKHANYIVNLGEATSVEVVGLIKHIQKTVQDRFQINLEIEPEIVDI